MKTGAQIVAELEGSLHTQTQNGAVLEKYWPTIRAALLAYEPKSALRAILDRIEHSQYVSTEELETARVELDALEQK